MGTIRSALFERHANDCDLRALHRAKLPQSEQPEWDSPHEAYDVRSRRAGQTKPFTWGGVKLNEQAQIMLFKLLMLRAQNYVEMMEADKWGGIATDDRMAWCAIELTITDAHLDHSTDPTMTPQEKAALRKRRRNNFFVRPSPIDDYNRNGPTSKSIRDLIDQLNKQVMLSCG